MRRAGKPANAPKEWPVAKRSERLTVLRRLAGIYETRLADVDGVVYACTSVLELLSGDRDALDRMERVLEKANDPRLEQTLEYHAQASASPAERASLEPRAIITHVGGIQVRTPAEFREALKQLRGPVELRTDVGKITIAE